MHPCRQTLPVSWPQDWMGLNELMSLAYGKVPLRALLCVAFWISVPVFFYINKQMWHKANGYEFDCPVLLVVLVGHKLLTVPSLALLYKNFNGFWKI